MKTRFLHHRTHLHLGMLAFFLAGCADIPPKPGAVGTVVELNPAVSPSDQRIIISVADQKMVLFEKGAPFWVFAVSTSKFGIGDTPGTGRTPLGRLEVVEKIGDGLPTGMVLHGRRPSGEF